MHQACMQLRINSTSHHRMSTLSSCYFVHKLLNLELNISIIYFDRAFVSKSNVLMFVAIKYCMYLYKKNYSLLQYHTCISIMIEIGRKTISDWSIDHAFFDWSIDHAFCALQSLCFRADNSALGKMLVIHVFVYLFQAKVTETVPQRDIPELTNYPPPHHHQHPETLH